MVDLIREKDFDFVLLFSNDGKPKTMENTFETIWSKKNPVVIVGGFPHGNYSREILRLANEIISVDYEMLDAWTITSRVIYEYERCISLPSKRLAHP